MFGPIINILKIQNTTANFLEYDIIFTRPISSLTILKIKPTQFAKKKYLWSKRNNLPRRFQENGNF